MSVFYPNSAQLRDETAYEELIVDKIVQYYAVKLVSVTELSTNSLINVVRIYFSFAREEPTLQM